MEESSENSVKEKRKYTHFEFADIHRYLLQKKYPENVVSNGDKANFRRSTRKFVVTDNVMYYIRRQKDGSSKQVCKRSMASFQNMKKYRL